VAIRKTVKNKAVRLYEDRLLATMRNTLFRRQVASIPGSQHFIKFYKYVAKMDNVKHVGKRMPQFKAEKNSASWLPINKTIEINHEYEVQQLALPLEVLDHFIEKTSHRVIVNYCGCRVATDCGHYSHDIGCLMMGESAALIPEVSRREVGIEEAKAHARKAIEHGLIPLVGKIRLDNDIFMIPDRGKLLTVCFCCECCCIMKFTKYASAESMDGVFHPVEGLSIEVTDDCVACGACQERCYIDAIEMDAGRAVIAPRCRICGRCVTHCPERAIKLSIDNARAARDVIDRIEAYVDVT